MDKYFTQFSNLIAVTSDVSIDFTPTDFDASLSEKQQAYLHHVTGQAIDKVFWRKQVHEDTVLNAKSIDASGCPDADAYITDNILLPIAIRTADCVPVLLFDPTRQVIGLAHAGWKGTVKSISAKTVNRMMQEYQCKLSDIQVEIGASINTCCYEVGPEFKELMPKAVMAREGKFYADVGGENIRQLIAIGINPANIRVNPLCTYCATGYHSYRRDGNQSGRMITLMMLLK